ncbi:MAG: hypothetical protein ACD_43C00156G0006 [uncultured bacterium]|nr:MAG: hypothetical protein ACD_43C00156G0006 [uncultured bacterium]
MDEFYLAKWIDLTKTSHGDLATGTTLIWEALAALSKYVQQHSAQRHIAASAQIHPTALIAEHVVISENVKIGPYCVVDDYVIIGNAVTLGYGCYIRSNSIIENNCALGHAVEIKHAWLGATVKLPHFNYIGDSILGSQVHLGGGALLANFKSDGSDIIVTAGQQRIPTGLRKFGAVLGDRAEIGAGAILNPGTLIGHDSIIYPGAIVRGVIPANKIYKVKSRDIEIVDRQ